MIDGLIELFKVIIYGIVEGITEWLPISSTGHLIILDKYMPLNVSAEFFEMFKVVIQLGAILAVLLIYFEKLNPFDSKKDALAKKETMSIWYKVAIATIPAVLVFPLDSLVEKYFMNYLTVALMLIVYGIAFIYIEKSHKKEVRVTDWSQLTYQLALLIGAAQVLALIPGTSRSGATILMAVILGTSRYIATEFSFFLGIPAMFGLSGLKLIKYGLNYSVEEIFIVIIGMCVSFVVSVIVINKLLAYIKKHDFTVFGKYRIALGILLIILNFLPK